MKYTSKLWRKTIIIISLALCLCTNGMAAVCAESAEITTEESSMETEDMHGNVVEEAEESKQPDAQGQESEQQERELAESGQQEAWSGTVRAIGQSSGVESAEITATEGRKLDGIYYTGFTINGGIGYCLQSSKDTPADAVYEIQQELDARDSFLSKAMYYAYGNPGYRAELWVPDCPQDTERAYLRSHLVLSYIYDAANTLDREVKDTSWVPWWQNYISETIRRLEGEAGVPCPGLSIAAPSVEAYFDSSLGVQRTRRQTLAGDVRNQIEIPLAEGMVLVNETKKTESMERGIINGGDSFYFKADAAELNGQTYESGEMYGTITNSWATLIVKTGGDKQDMGMGVLYPAQTAPVSLAVSWLPAPKLRIVKNADRETKVYKKGELITYSLEITQEIPKAVAKNLVIEDSILTEGVKLQKNSVVLLDQDKKVIQDAEITVQGNDFHISGGKGLDFLEYVENGHRLYVEYQVLVISDEMEVVENTAKVRGSNAPEESDDEAVEIEKPKEPAPDEPKPEKTVKTETVPTGDNANLIVLILCLILSCAVIAKYGRISHRK